MTISMDSWVRRDRGGGARVRVRAGWGWVLLASGCNVGETDTGAPGSGHVTLVTAASDPSGGDSGGSLTGSGMDGTAAPTSGGMATDGPTSGTASEPTDGATSDATAGGGDGFCQERCEADADCEVMGAAHGFTCSDGRCREVAGSCAADLDCRVEYSGWSVGCGAQQDCPGQVCIDIGGGVGRCATAPTDFLKCETLKLSEITMPPIEGGAPLSVCAELDYACRDERCVDPCESDADCVGVLGHPRCEVGSGVCRCAGDDDCEGARVDGWSACHDGVCGCTSDADCRGVNTDVCAGSGSCGCTSAAVCTGKMFDGTMSVCEGR